MAEISARYWVSTVSREHVKVGEEGGFCQVCHGKKGPLARMKQGDWLIYYSPRERMGAGEACQKFTAIGQIADDHIFAFRMSEEFVPFRRKVNYLQEVTEVSIHDLKKHLSFTKTKNWGAKLRFGIFEISREDFEVIRDAMGGV